MTYLEIIEAQQKHLDRMEQENAVLREGLEFYKSRASYTNLIPGGDNTTWVEHDGGHKAREALDKTRVLREGGK